ncbi:ABC transporter transmembrane domain-containing protein [Cellulomonas carbonis]|uniref:ABC transporter permease n=1 Tax=Cellulomonas carbonis T26 TaxID=947969 RepID=A0A0A0BLZ6_9CELL|nr:ABC transporter ATP-binding protein [Cellulomonas carbonis]KGM09543.1 ABC transporter permease [Cellulomonas carbonis T26]
MRPLPYVDPGRPPLTTPAAYLRWVARRQAGLLVASSVAAVASSVAMALLPYLLGRVVDGGLDGGLSRELVDGCLLLLAAGLVMVVANVVGHRWDVENWMRGAFRTSQLVGHHVSRTGDAVTAELPTGEVVSTVASDSLRVGEVFYVTARFVGGVVAYLVVAALLLSSSVVLGVAVLVGLPAVAGVLALIVRPLQRRQAAQREAAGRLTTLGSDTVSGLRILRGIGGEDEFTGRYREQSQRVRAAGVRVAGTQSLLDGLQTLLPGLFVAGVVWIGARLAVTGEITPGQLVTFYGYASFLTEPLTAATNAVHVVTRALVGVGKILRVLQVPVTGAEDAGAAAASAAVATAAGADGSDDGRAQDLADEPSGLHVRGGAVTALVSADPDETARIATRLGLLGREHEQEAARVLLGGVPLDRLGLAEVRRRVVVAESTPHLFTGVLRDELDVRGGRTEAELLGAMATADAQDVLDAVPGGLDGEVAEKGRSLSGGQRQRLALARALLTDPEVLVLVEPTSAVDAHTEARIAERLTRARAGRTTVVVTASPLVLDRVDEVALVRDGTVRAVGTHRGLLDGAAGPAAAAEYRSVVSRAAADDARAPVPGSEHTTTPVAASGTTASPSPSPSPGTAPHHQPPADLEVDVPAPRAREEDHREAARR